MNSLEEIRKEFFGDRRHVAMLYSEAPQTSKLHDLFEDVRPMICFEDEHLTDSNDRLLAAGMFPIMIVKYAYEFRANISARDVLPHLNAETEHCSEGHFRAFYVSKNEAISSFESFMEGLRTRASIERYEPRRKTCVFDVRRGEHLRIVYFAQEPLPGTRALA